MTTCMIKDMPDDEKPREKAMRYGIRCLSNEELLAVLLRTGSQGCSVLETAANLLRKSKGIAGLAAMETKELLGTKGIGISKALQLQACFELSRRIALDKVQNKDVIRDPESLVFYLQKEIGMDSQETFLAVYLDAGNKVIEFRRLFTGTLDQSMVYPREIFREALVLKAAGIMVVHNHPSGNATPSTADLATTHRLLHAASLMNVRLLDHLIVTSNDVFSFHRAGLMTKLMEEKGTEW